MRPGCAGYEHAITAFRKRVVPLLDQVVLEFPYLIEGQELGQFGVFIHVFFHE
jgi:hypothetical protein